VFSVWFFIIVFERCILFPLFILVRYSLLDFLVDVLRVSDSEAKNELENGEQELPSKKKKLVSLSQHIADNLVGSPNSLNWFGFILALRVSAVVHTLGFA
jgi:hypothetical protein